MLYILLSILLGLLTFIFFNLYINIKQQHQSFKKDISKLLNVLADDPAVEYLIHILEMKLNENENRVENCRKRLKNIYGLLDNLPEAIMIVSIDEENAKVIYANSNAEKMFITDEYYNKTLTYLFTNLEINEIVMESVKKDEDIKKEVSFYIPEKKFFLCDVRKLELESPKKEIKYRLIILRDITKEIEIENMRKDFLMILSHELRTPLTAIQGYAQTLLISNILNGEAKKFVEIIESESSRLSRLVNDILDAYRLERDIISTKFKELDLSKIVEKTFKVFEYIANKKGIELIKEIEDNLVIMGDEDRILQVLFNLIDNAIKFTAIKSVGEKKVWIRAYKENNYAVFEVEDTGIGIPKKELNKIFQIFYKVDKSRTHQIPGVGLGLYLVKLIIKNLKGDLYIESDENEGTFVKVKIPLKSGGPIA